MQEAERLVGSFPSKKDRWVVSVLSLTGAIEVIAAAALITIGPSSLWLNRVLPLLLTTSAVLVVWSLFGTSYRIVGAVLVTRSGPFSSRVPIASIASVAPIHSVDAAAALSTDRLELCCANPEKHVLVSPEEPAAFIAALRRVNPTINVVGEVQTRG